MASALRKIHPLFKLACQPLSCCQKSHVLDIPKQHQQVNRVRYSWRVAAKALHMMHTCFQIAPRLLIQQPAAQPWLTHQSDTFSAHQHPTSLG